MSHTYIHISMCVHIISMYLKFCVITMSEYAYCACVTD